MLLTIAAVLLGIIGRTIIPYLETLRANPDTPFDRKFFVPAIVSIVIALITSPLVFAAIPPEQLDLSKLNGVAMLAGFAALFVASWGLTDIARSAQKFLTK